MSDWIKTLLEKMTDRALLVGLLLIFGIVLTVTVIPGVFIIDEDNYLVTVVSLQHGMLKMPGTENLTPSRELVYFDPEANQRLVQSTPVVSLVAPIYAFIALPFSYLGLRGLIFLNILSYLVSIYLVFGYVEKIARQRTTPWLACTLFALGGYCIEYAQGLWPQMLSIALCLGTLILCHRARQKDSLQALFVSGMLVGLAIGVREPNICFAGCVGVGLILFSGKHRYRDALSYALGAALVLSIIATINFCRFGIWHPFPKVVAYADVIVATTASSSVFEPLRVFWSKIVDYSSYGPNTDHIRSGFYYWDAASGTALMNGIVKKALIQSSPWIALSLLVMTRSLFQRRPNSSGAMQEIRVLGLIAIPTLIVFLAAGFNRTDGLSFNQRYFLELVPLFAIGLSLVFDSIQFRFIPAIIGLVLGMIFVIGILELPTSAMRHLGQRYIPLLLALGFILAWYFLKDRKVLFLLLGVCVGWALFLHLESDLVGSRFRREVNATRLEYLRKIVPDHSALFTYWGNKDAAGPLQLTKDVVILDAWADGGQDASRLRDELLGQQRRVFVLENDMPVQIVIPLLADRDLHDCSVGTLKMVEILPRGIDHPE